MAELSDEELVNLVKQGNIRAEAILYNKYYHLALSEAKRVASQFRITGIEIDDLVSVSFESVKKSIDLFENGTTRKFYSYWRAISYNSMINYIRDNRTQSGKYSLDNLTYQDNETITFHDIVSNDETSVSNEINVENLKHIIESFIYNPTNNLTDDEALVAHYLYYRQYDNEEIKAKTGWDSPKIYYVVKNTRKKISDYLKKRIFK